MESDFRRFLVDFYKSFFYGQAMPFLERQFANDFRFEDEDRQRFRSSEELKEIEENVADRCEALSRELVDELEIKGITSSQDFIAKNSLVEQVQEDYTSQFERYLREL